MEGDRESRWVFGRSEGTVSRLWAQPVGGCFGDRLMTGNRGGGGRLLAADGNRQLGGQLDSIFQ